VPQPFAAGPGDRLLQVPPLDGVSRAGTGRTRWAMRWKPALNAFAITFGDRFPAAETY
jgi:hypothetical protein